MSNDISRLVDAVGNALLQLSDAFQDPASLSLADVHSDMERLEAFINSKALIDASFAYICERDEAGRLVGGNYANAYLKERLGISNAEAFDRLARGRDLFAPPPAEPVADSPVSDPAEEDQDLFGAANQKDEEAARLAAEAERRKREEEQRRAQEEAREAAGKISAEKQAIIRRELDKLLSAARGERQRILSLAMKAAQNRDENDLRMFVRRHVEEANREHAPRSNPNAGHENRNVQIGRRKADGTVDISVTTTAGHAALIKAHLDKGLAPNSNIPDVDPNDAIDSRTPGQRRYDQFFSIFSRYESSVQKDTGGAASVVVSMTIDDLADADAFTLFQTNTGIDVDCFDLVRLGMDGTADFILQLDSVTGVPLSMGKTRCASIPQRIAMLAVQGVCSWAGCTKPLTECEAHHIFAWIEGGNTDITNLTGLCREHHRRNNDERDGSGGKGHMDYDLDTGRAGLVRSGTSHLEFNQSDPAEHSAGNRIRNRFRLPRPAPRLGPDPKVFPSGRPQPRHHVRG